MNYPFTHETINAAIKAIQSEDQSPASDQARQLAKQHLLGATQAMTDLGNLKPGSSPARYLFDESARLRKIAVQVGLPK